MFVATDNLLADAAADAAAAVEWLRKSFFGAKFVRDLFFGTFFFYFHFSLPKLLPVVNIYGSGRQGGGK
jgi:hypothetical protein